MKVARLLNILIAICLIFSCRVHLKLHLLGLGKIGFEARKHLLWEICSLCEDIAMTNICALLIWPEVLLE
jgi:hypothetical protein